MRSSGAAHALAKVRVAAASCAVLLAAPVIPRSARAQGQSPADRSAELPANATTVGPTIAPAGIAHPSVKSTVAGVEPVTASVGALGSFAAPTTAAHRDWWIPAASAIVPGAGQARLGQDRFVGYMAVEGFLWIRYLTDRRAGTDARNAYRDMALRVSRAGFPGPKPQGNFEYYERMEHWVASGVYDSDPGVGFAPEADTTTFNGKMWSIARTTYWSDPKTPPPVGSAQYEAALRFYRQNAVTPEFEWSWRNAPLHQDVYRRNVRASNDGFRHAAQDIGAVIANHVLSTVDAYISLRLRLGESTDTGTSSLGIGATLPFATIDRIVNRPPRNDRTK